MFLMSLFLIVLCYKAVSSQGFDSVTQFSDIQRWSEQEDMDAHKLSIDADFFISYFSVNCAIKRGICQIESLKNETQLECGRTLNTTEDRNQVYLLVRLEGLDILETTIGYGNVGEPLECTIVHGIQPLRNFVKTHPELMKFRDIIWQLKQLLFISKCMRSTFRVLSFYAQPSASGMEYEDHANCNLCLTEREWVSVAIACVVLALYIQIIVLSRLRREQIRIHNPVSETVKLPH